MDNAAALPLVLDQVVRSDPVSHGRRRLGAAILAAGSLILAAILILQILYKADAIAFGFVTWRPVLYAYLLWAVTLGISQVLRRGEAGARALFVLPAILFIISMVVFPLLFGLYISFTDWNLSSTMGRRLNGFDNIRQMWRDPFYWNALYNMVLYTLAVLVEYAIAFGLALLLHSQIRARKFFRVVFLLPLMLSPVAVSWMVGKSMMEIRFGPVANFARWLGWDTPAFFTDPWFARISIMVMDAWTFIPLMMIMLLAGLQAVPKEVTEAAKVDGANSWQTFWRVVFPLTLPVSITAILIRIIFKLKIADIIINVTSGGPGGATDSVTSFIFREYRDRSNVGYGTLLAMVYLVMIVVFLTVLLNLFGRWMRGYDQQEA
ncbi:sugar ABC transporter permease [Chelativorans sp.]|uniref:carbohydrate ABC transporter permease n=1 Tax=Chelativorans sp. TaxID=2203393 RepID=UPI002811F5F1|nr:sugar ABC transporter permease [Chelativorans sp.]